MNGFQQVGREFKDEYEFRGYMKRFAETTDKRLDKIDKRQDEFYKNFTAMKIKLAFMAGGVSVVVTTLFSFALHLLSR
jgi:hypothetical protein